MKKLILAALFAYPAMAQTQQPWQVTYGGYAPWQAQDKLDHFQTGLIGGCIAYTAFHALSVKNPTLWLILAGLVIGLGKEVWDRHHHGTPELMDALNTAAGFATPALVFRIRF